MAWRKATGPVLDFGHVLVAFVIPLLTKVDDLTLFPLQWPATDVIPQVKDIASVDDFAHQVLMRSCCLDHL